MSRILFWTVAAVIAGVILWIVVMPGKDYHQLAQGRWLEAKNQILVEVTFDKIKVTLPRGREVVAEYVFHTERDPMEVEIRYGKSRKGPYIGLVEFKSDDKIVVRKKPLESDKGDYFAEMGNAYTAILNRVESPPASGES